MNLLLVDDEVGIREGLAAILRMRGYTVRTAASCSEAEGRLQQEEFDLIVSDWRLGDGTAARFLANTEIPAYVSTGYADDVADALDVAQTSIVDILPKPVSPSDLCSLLQRHGSEVAADDPAVSEAAYDAPLAGLPSDTRIRIELLRRLVDGEGGLAPVALLDDGPVLTLAFDRVPKARERAWLAEVVADQRVTAGGARFEVRLQRDGAPATCDRIVDWRTPPDRWPEVEGALAIDCEGFGAGPAVFRNLLEAVAARRDDGRSTELFNVPESLRLFAERTGNAHVMPMRAVAGPTLTPVFAALWS